MKDKTVRRQCYDVYCRNGVKYDHRVEKRALPELNKEEELCYKHITFAIKDGQLNNWAMPRKWCKKFKLL